LEANDTIRHFLDEGLITSVIRPIKSGKEASVHLCRANPSTTGLELAALKRYHPLDRRDFRDESIYRDGEWIKERRIRVALEKKTRFGREVQGAIWVSREYEMLRTLSTAGADVPTPVASSDDGILMTYVGDVDQSAPQLHRYRADRDEAQALFDQLIKNVELMLYVNVVHADLSPFNVLVWQRRATIIDLPQAVDPRKNRHARRLLERDVERICAHFARLGVRSDPHGIAHDLWTAWTFADLVPEELRGLI
jgi:RIO kinase 1